VYRIGWEGWRGGGVGKRREGGIILTLGMGWI